MLAAQASAAYLKEGRRIDVPSEKLFEHHWLVDIEGVGTFETYPNRNSTRYASYFGLVEDNLMLYRGLLRFIGWCNTMQAFIKLNLLEGVHMPTLPEIYNPVLAELESFNFKFEHKIVQLS